MESITLSPKQQEIQAFVKKYQDHLVPSKNPHIQYFFRLDQATVSVFSSGKVLFQGAKAAHYAGFFGHQADKSSSSPASQNFALIGTDEVGNGSYFGGLAQRDRKSVV